ncbi:MAG: Ig-like domain-containing protein [bacterium]|nr:Ig-like domain-containing protein [bacterium]
MTLNKKIIFGLVLGLLLSFHVCRVSAFVTETVTTDNTNTVTVPCIVVDSTYAYAVWQQRETDGYTHIYYKRKGLTGSWADSTPELVSSEQLSASARNPRIAIDSTYVYVTWEDDSNYESRGGDSKIVFKRKALAGTWPAATEVVSTESTAEAKNPQIILDANYVYITWDSPANLSGSGTDRDICYKRKSLGDVWPASTEIVSTESTYDSKKPVIALDNASVYIAWYDEDIYAGGAYILYKKKDLNGTWPLATETISTETVLGQWADAPTISLVVAANIVHVAWRDNTEYAGTNGTFFRIAYKKKMTSGTWPATEVVSTESTGNGITPCLAADDTNVYIVWADSSNYNNAGSNSHIFFKKKPVNDSGWGTDTGILSTESTGNAYTPNIALSAGTFYVIWEDSSEFGYGHDFSHIVYRSLSSNPPQVAITYPNGGETLSGTVNITATATDADSSISSVAFYYTANDGLTSTLIGTDTSAPFQFSWDSTKIFTSGNYKIKAIVTSADGGQGTDLSDESFYVNKYADDTTFNYYSFVTNATATCYKGSTSSFPLATESNIGTQVTDTSALQNADTTYESATDTNANYTYMKFNFKITDVVANITYFRVYWKGYTSTPNSGVYLYLWNKTLGRFDRIDGYSYDMANVGVHELNSKVNLSAVTIANYVKADGTVQVLVETTDDGSGLVSVPIGIYTDYVRLEVSTDLTPPAAISNLQAAPGNKRGELVLTWTAPGDDGNIRTATNYLVKYATATFGGAEWDTSYLTGISSTTLPVPQEAGNTETYTLTGLTTDVRYWFGIKTEDEVPNTSLIDTTSPQANSLPKGNSLPLVTFAAITTSQSDNITINYNLVDFDADTCTISVSYSLDGGTTFTSATKGSGGNNMTGLTTNSTTATSYSFVWDSVADIGQVINETVQIRISANDGYGTGTGTTGNFTVDNLGNLDAITGDFSYPNPYKPKLGPLTIRYILNEDKGVTISIYNIYGELIKETHYDASTTGGSKGVNKVTWDGKNADNEAVASGVYLVHIKAEGFEKTSKVALVK